MRRGLPGSDTYYSFYVGKIALEEEEPFYYDSDWANILGAIEFIKQAPKDQPLCLYLPILYPHPPYAVEEPWYSRIDRSVLPKRIAAHELRGDKPSMLSGLRERYNMQGWTEERWTELRATYYGMCASGPSIRPACGSA